MGARPSIRYEVHITPHLRALRAAQRARPRAEWVAPEPPAHPQSANTPTAADPTPETSEVDATPNVAATAMPSRRIRLRRDGARPLVFDGLPLFTAEHRAVLAEAGPARDAATLRLAIYLDAGSSELVVQTSCEPSHPGPIRQVFRAERVADDEALWRCLRGFRPERAIALTGTDAAAPWRCAAAQALRDAAAALISSTNSAGDDRRKETACPT